MFKGLLASLSGTEVLIDPKAVGRFEAGIRAVENLDVSAGDGGTSFAPAMGDFWGEPGSYLASLRPYTVVGGVLRIPVYGSLLSGFPYQYGSYATGYEYIRAAFDRGMDDKDVRAIALLINSPGGMVHKNFDLVDAMFARRGEKPIRAYADDSAYSAAYSIASVADKIVVNRTGGVGSIGVVTMHVDMSKALDSAGIKITYIYAGKHKVDGNPYQELDSGVKERMQARIDALYGIFTATVARNRGIEESVVRGTEALTYSAEEAIKIGLADAVGSFAEAVAAFERELTETDNMSNPENKTVALTDSDLANARNEGVSEGAKKERERIAAIIGCDEAKTRRASAINIALKSDLNVETAKSLLATLPEDKAPEASGKSDFEKAMEISRNPEIGAGSEATTPENMTEAQKVEAFFASIGRRK